MTAVPASFANYSQTSAYDDLINKNKQTKKTNGDVEDGESRKHLKETETKAAHVMPDLLRI